MSRTVFLLRNQLDLALPSRSSFFSRPIPSRGGFSLEKKEKSVQDFGD